jgi:hypothetical protein
LGDVHGDAPALSRVSIRDQTTKIVNKSNSGSLAMLAAIRGASFHVLPDGCIRDDEVQFHDGGACTRHIMPQPSTSAAHPHCCA